MSLKSGLKKIIQNYNGATFTHGEFEEFCKRNGNKVSNGERRMRELTNCEGPEIGITASKKGAIIGYYWKKVSYPSQMKLGSL